MKNKIDDKKIMKNLKEISEYSDISVLETMQSMIDLAGFKGNMLKLLCNMISTEDIDPSKIKIYIHHALASNFPDEYRRYFNTFKEKDKLHILEQLPRLGMTILRSDFTDIGEYVNNIPGDKRNYDQSRYYRNIYIGTPMDFLAQLGCSEYLYLDKNKEELPKYLKLIDILYKTINDNAEYFFKHIDLIKTFKGQVYFNISYQLKEKGPDSYVMKAILRRISFFNEKRITKPTIIKFIDIISNPEMISEENRKAIMIALNEHVPAKIMLDVSL